MEVTLRLDDVTVDNALNPRVGALDQEAVLEYSQHCDQLPPMQVFEVAGEGYLLVAGFHRYAAHRLAGRDEAPFIVHQGDREAAAEFADLDNLKHGLRLTRAEKRAVIESAEEVSGQVQPEHWTAILDPQPRECPRRPRKR